MVKKCKKISIVLPRKYMPSTNTHKKLYSLFHSQRRSILWLQLRYLLPQIIDKFSVPSACLTIKNSLDHKFNILFEYLTHLRFSEALNVEHIKYVIAVLFCKLIVLNLSHILYMIVSVSNSFLSDLDVVFLIKDFYHY